MRTTSIIIAALTLCLGASASPATRKPSSRSVSRIPQSSQGWYSYGCYQDCTDGMNRNLPTLAFKDPDNTPEQCIQACEDLGYTYAGLQFGDECYCGDRLAGLPTRPAECDVQCTDGSKCGGPCRNNIWSAFRKPGH